MGAEVSGAQVSGDTLVDSGVFTEHSISPQSAILQRETRHHQNGGRKDMLYVAVPQKFSIFIFYFLLLIYFILYNYVELIICTLNHYFSVILNTLAPECIVKKLWKFQKCFNSYLTCATLLTVFGERPRTRAAQNIACVRDNMTQKNVYTQLN